MKICVAQTRPIKGDIQGNIVTHKRLIEMAVSFGAEIVIFPELSITGYEPELAKELATSQDDSRFDEFQRIAESKRVTIGVGVPTGNPDGICISMVLLHPDGTRQTYSKKYIHADEEPFFISGQNATNTIRNSPDIALAICYEISVPQHAEDAFRSGAKIYLASAVKSRNQFDKGVERLSEIARQYSMTVFLSNCIGETGGYDSAGKSSIINEEGIVIGQLDDANEGVLILDTETKEVTARNI